MAVFELSYNGIPFVIPNQDILDRVEKWLHIEDMREAEWDAQFSSGRSARRLNTVAPKIPGWLGLYKLYVPSTASRFSVFRGIVGRSDAEAMAAGEVAGGMSISYGYTAHLLKLRTESDADPIIARMLLLPPRPIVGVNGTSDLYLVTLVDERYFWSWQSPFYGTISEGPDTSKLDSWDSFLEFIPSTGFAVEPLLFESAIEAEYGKPERDSDLYTFSDNAGATIDSALANLGRTACPVLDSGIIGIPSGQSSSFWAVTWAEANAHLQSVKTALADRKKAGGTSWGESGADAMRARILPASVRVFFPCWRDGFGYETGVDASNGAVPDADLRSWSHGDGMTVAYVSSQPASGLSLPYSAFATTADTFFNIRDTAKAMNIDGDGVPQNQTELEDLAERLAKDFYDHMLLSTDICYNGLVQAWSEPHGLDVVWDYLESTTRIMCPGPHRHQTEMQHSFGDEPAPRCDTSVTTTHPAGVTVTIDHGFLPENLPYGGGAESLLEITLEPGTYIVELDASFSYGVSGGAGPAGVQSYWVLTSGSCKGVPPSSKIEYATGVDDTSYTITAPQHWSFVAIVLTDSVLNFYGTNYGGASSISAYEAGYPKVTTLK